MDLKQMLKQIKETEKNKANTFTLNVQQNKLEQKEKKENLDKNTNINLESKPETKTNQSITKNKWIYITKYSLFIM